MRQIIVSMAVVALLGMWQYSTKAEPVGRGIGANYLPDVVVNAVLKDNSKLRIMSGVIFEEQSKTWYRVAATDSKEDYEYDVSSDGKILKKAVIRDCGGCGG